MATVWHNRTKAVLMLQIDISHNTPLRVVFAETVTLIQSALWQLAQHQGLIPGPSSEACETNAKLRIYRHVRIDT